MWQLSKIDKWCEALSFRIVSGGQHWKTGGSSTLWAPTPFDRFFSHGKNVPEVVRGWDPHDFWRSFAWRSRFFRGGTGKVHPAASIGDFLVVIVRENIKIIRKKPHEPIQTKIYAKIRLHANFQVNLSTRKKLWHFENFTFFCNWKFSKPTIRKDVGSIINYFVLILSRVRQMVRSTLLPNRPWGQHGS